MYFTVATVSSGTEQWYDILESLLEVQSCFPLQVNIALPNLGNIKCDAPLLFRKLKDYSCSMTGGNNLKGNRQLPQSP